jgi:hypothetical protein
MLYYYKRDINNLYDLMYFTSLKKSRWSGENGALFFIILEKLYKIGISPHIIKRLLILR